MNNQQTLVLILWLIRINRVNHQLQTCQTGKLLQKIVYHSQSSKTTTECNQIESLSAQHFSSASEMNPTSLESKENSERLKRWIDSCPDDDNHDSQCQDENNEAASITVIDVNKPL